MINLLYENIDENHKKRIIYILIACFFIKLIYSLSSPYFFLAEDELSSYDGFAWKIAKSWFRGSVVTFDRNSDSFFLNGVVALPATYNGYFIFNAIIYYFFGHHFLIARLFGLFFNVFSGVLIYFIARNLFNLRTAQISFVLFSFTPEIGFWSLALLKEGPMIFLILLLFLFFLIFCRTIENSFLKSLLYLFLTGVVFFVLFELRDYVAFLLIVSCIAWFVFSFFKNNKSENLGKITYVLLLFLVCFFLFQPIFLNESFLSVKKIENFGVLNVYRNLDENHGRLAFYTSANISSISGVLRFLPVGLVYTFFSVLPFEVKSPDLLAYFIFNTVWWYFLLFFIFLGIIFSLKVCFFEAVPMLIFCILMIVFTSLVEGNFGNLLRHSVQFKAVLLIFAAYGLNKTFPVGFYLKYFKTR